MRRGILWCSGRCRMAAAQRRRGARATWAWTALTATILAGAGGAVAPQVGRAASTFDVTTFGADPTGVRDSARGIQQAINAAQAAGPGNTVYIPTGTYQLYLQVPGSNSLQVTGTVPVTIRGDGPQKSVIIEDRGKNALVVQVDGTIVTGLQLDTQTHNDRAALVMAASSTRLTNALIKGGDHTFALFYPGPTGASRTNLIYDTDNHIRGVTVSDRWGLDGFSFSFQRYGRIQNVDHTGSRLALFVDRDVVVDNEHFHPGPQANGTQGFWITAPSNNITINGFVTDGNGGTLGSGGQFSTDIRINNLVFNRPGFHMSVGEVRNLTLDGCNFGSNNTLRFLTVRTANPVVVTNCTLPVVRFTQPATGTVHAEFDNDTFTTFTPVPREGAETFLNSHGGSTQVTVNGGTFQNCAGGFSKGRNTVFTVTGLAGYPCPAASAERGP